MASNDFQTVVDRKNHMRRAAYDARNAQSNKDELSKIICDKFISLPEYLTADTIMWYVDVRSEVRTRPQLIDALKGDKRIVVPYCVDDVLHLWWLQGMDELVQGMWKILEPPKQRWGEAKKRISPEELDLIMVPGVAFDGNGGRLGNGKGYYDKLMAEAGKNTRFVAVAFESQLFPEVPTGENDIFMGKIVTEKAIYQGKTRG